MPRYNFPIILIMCTLLFGFNPGEKPGKVSKVLTNDHYNFISVNEIKMYISNDGDGSHSPLTDSQGLFWPGGPSAAIGATFEDGLVWGGIIDNDTLCGGSTYRHGLQAGKILPDGTADDPSLPKYRVYKVLNGWENLPPGPERDQYEMDYNEWPAEDGAPFNDLDHDGIYTPGVDNPYIGDETMWCVSNDLDPSRTTYLYGSMPMGLEVHTLVYAFDQSGFLGNTVFKKYTLINKGQNTINNLLFTYWSDDDLGNAQDDFVGCDVNLNLGYTYNADNNDEGGYGTPPPAIGKMFVQGPVIPGSSGDSAFIKDHWKKGFKNLSMSAFGPNFKNSPGLPTDPILGEYEGTIESYNLQRGLINDGDTLINPHNNEPTVFALSGDPAVGTGWFEGSAWPGGPPPGDRRYYITTGPLTMAPGDTQEVVIAIFLSQGSNNIQSVAALKERGLEIQNYYGAYNITGVKESAPSLVRDFKLLQNYPNPFNPVTNISFVTSRSSFVSLKVYDVLGREVAALVNEEKQAGTYSIQFDGSNLASGIYYYRMKAGDFTATKKSILLK